MKMYVVRWSDMDADQIQQFRVMSSVTKARQFYQKLKKETKDNADIVLGDEATAITEVEVKGKAEMLHLMNTLGGE